MKEIVNENCMMIYSYELEALWATDTLLLGEKYRKPLLEFFSEEQLSLYIKKYRFIYNSSQALSALWVNGMSEFLADYDVSDFSLKEYKAFVSSVSDADYLAMRLNLDDEKKASFEKALSDDNLFNDLYLEYEEKCPDYLGFYSFTHERARFIEDFFNLVSDMMTPAFISYCKSFENKAQEFFNKVRSDLAGGAPLEVSQKLMGKTFGNRGPYSRFVFSPALFTPARGVRLFYSDSDIDKSSLRQQLLFISLYFSALPTAFRSDKTVSALKSMSDSTRYRILTLLSAGDPVYGLDIVKALSIAPSTVSHHMDQLKSAGLVNEEPVRQAKYYSINKKNVKELISALQKDLKIE